MESLPTGMVGTRQFDEDALLQAARKAFWQSPSSMIDVAESHGDPDPVAGRHTPP